MAKRKPEKDYQEILDKALSEDYDGTKEQRQTDVCEAWNEVYIGKDKKKQRHNGIVYTPVEIVDFIVNSVAKLAEKEFGVSLDDDSVEVLDPFAGTGIFGARYADLGYDTDNLTCYEIDPNTAEIANKNISISAGKKFDNTKVVDTFELYENDWFEAKQRPKQSPEQLDLERVNEMKTSKETKDRIQSYAEQIGLEVNIDEIEDFSVDTWRKSLTDAENFTQAMSHVYGKDEENPELLKRYADEAVDRVQRLDENQIFTKKEYELMLIAITKLQSVNALIDEIVGDENGSDEYHMA